VHEWCWCRDPADLPAGGVERLAAARDRHRALAGTAKGRDRHVRLVEREMLVHLVGDDERVIRGRELDNEMECLARKDRSGRIVRIVDEDEASALRSARAGGVDILVLDDLGEHRLSSDDLTRAARWCAAQILRDSASRSASHHRMPKRAWARS
jgi:hypothetical protein